MIKKEEKYHVYTNSFKTNSKELVDRCSPFYCAVIARMVQKHHRKKACNS